LCAPRRPAPPPSPPGATRSRVTNRSPHPLPPHSNRCHPERSEGSWLVRPLALFQQSLLCRHAFSRNVGRGFSTVSFLSLSPFLAPLTGDSQLIENPATLS